MKKTSEQSPRTKLINLPTRSIGGKRGNMKPAEIKPLVMAARKAYDRQSEAGLVDDGETFDAWRHRHCMEAVGRPGITACNHDDFRPLLAHFQTLSGDDASAFTNLMQTGKPTDHAAAGDTFEERRILAHQIAERLAAHIHLAETSIPDLLAEAVEAHYQSHQFQPWPGSVSAQEFQKRLRRKYAIMENAKGPITVGYLIWIVRSKTRRPDLQLGKDWQSALVDRCTVTQLDQIRSTIVNRIAAVEGVGESKSRNRKQRSQKRSCGGAA